ncbi:MAG: amidase family protein, partial [Candidatus Hinthialibacter sp.]
GASLLGSVRMAELGFGLDGDAVAQAFTEEKCDVALAADAMGEARVSASLAGAFGFKPSWGIVSRFGLIGWAPSMECYGIAARSINDISLVMNEIVFNDRRDPSMIQSQLPDFTKMNEPDRVTTVGVVRELFEAMTDEETQAMRSALSMLEQSGIRIQETSLPDFELSRTVHQIIGAVEASSSAGKYDGVRYGHRTENSDNWNEMYLQSRAESFSLTMKSYLFQGAYFQFQDYPSFENACRLRRRLVNHTKKLFDEVDVLVFPTRRVHANNEEPSTVDAVYDSFAYTLFANVVGLPSITIPGFVRSGEEDLGFQLVGDYLDDVRLLSLADRLTR